MVSYSSNLNRNHTSHRQNCEWKSANKRKASVFANRFEFVNNTIHLRRMSGRRQEIPGGEVNFSNTWRDISRLIDALILIRKTEKGRANTCVHATKHNCERRPDVKSAAEAALDA
jgi:hypothetical protein